MEAFRLARGELAPPIELMNSDRWSLGSSGLLSWGHFISSDIIDLIETDTI